MANIETPMWMQQVYKYILVDNERVNNLYIYRIGQYESDDFAVVMSSDHYIRAKNCYTPLKQYLNDMKG